MAQSGSLKFAPILHNITPDKVVFCYRLGDSDSLEVANHYKLKREIPPENLIGLPCSSEPLITEDEYIGSIENPLLQALEELGNRTGSSGQKEIWAIIFGYNVPVSFYEYSPYDPYGDPYGANVIAIASRAHRLGQSREDKFPNVCYDRRGAWKYFDADDAEDLYITAVLNGPTKQSVINLIDRSIDVDSQIFITGSIYLDPYGNRDTNLQLQYEEDLLDFNVNELPNLGLTSQLTVPSRHDDPTVLSFSGDSFYFGWFTPRYSPDLFADQNIRRVFLYNADDDGASNITLPLDENGSDPWCNIAINIDPGYAATAGAVHAPGEDSYLRPRPFFEALHKGAGIGEAFLYASPHVDWRVILIGDPLMVVNFPVPVPNNQDFIGGGVNLINNNETIRRIKENIEESVAYGRRQSILTNDIVNYVVGTTNLAEAVSLLQPTKTWRDVKNKDAQHSLFIRLVDTWVNYIRNTTSLSLQDWLDREGEKITSFLNDVIFSGVPQGLVQNEFIYPEGQWQYEFTYVHPRRSLESVHFEVELSSSSDFSSITTHVSTYSNIEGWKYEIDPNKFVQIVNTGLLSNFSGRRIRFISPIDRYLERTSLHYVRWRILDSDGLPITNWNIDSKVMIIKR